MSYYGDQEAVCLWRELAHIYPELAPPREERDAELDKIDLFGEDPEDKEAKPCPSKD